MEDKVNQDSCYGEDEWLYWEEEFSEVDKFLLEMDADIMEKLREVMGMIEKNKKSGVKIHEKNHAAGKKIRELRDRNQKLRDKLDKQTKENTELAGKADALTKQMKDLEERIAHLMKEKSDLEKDWGEEKKKLTGEKVKLEEEKNRLTEQNKELAGQKAALGEEKERVTGQKEELKRKNEDLKEENRKLGEARDNLQEEMPAVLRLREAYHETVDLLTAKGRTEGFPKESFANLHMGPEGCFEDFLSKALDPEFPGWYCQNADAFVAACQSGPAVAYEAMAEVLSGLDRLLDAVFDLGRKSFMEKGIRRLQVCEGELLREDRCAYINSGAPYAENMIKKVWMNGIEDEGNHRIYRSFVEGDW